MTPYTPIKIIKGRQSGETGRIARVDDRWIWVTLDRYKNDRVYRKYQFGPYIAKELLQI